MTVADLNHVLEHDSAADDISQEGGVSEVGANHLPTPRIRRLSALVQSIWPQQCGESRRFPAAMLTEL